MKMASDHVVQEATEERVGSSGSVSVDPPTLVRSGRKTCRPSLILKPWMARKQLCHRGPSFNTTSNTDPVVDDVPPPGNFTPFLAWKPPSKEFMAIIMKEPGVAQRLADHEYKRWRRVYKKYPHAEKKKKEKMTGMIENMQKKEEK